jgi:hypothetical protein
MKTFYSISLLVALPLFNMLFGQVENSIKKPLASLHKSTLNTNRNLPDWRPWQEVFYNWNSINESWDLYTNTDFSYSGGHLSQSDIDYPDGIQPLKRIIYSYNDAGNKTAEITQILNGSTYENQSKQVTLYANNGFETGFENWEWISNSWVLIEGDRRVDEYNTDNLLAISKYQSFDYENLFWETTREITISYNASHKIAEIINRSINTLPNILENDQKFYLKYAGFSIRPDSVYLSSWDGFNWILAQRAIDIEWPAEFIPIVEAAPFSYVLQNDATGIWLDEERMSTLFLSGGFVELTEHFINEMWVPFSRITEEIDERGNITLDKSEYFLGDAWLIISMDVYLNTYDSADRLFEVVAQFWNSNSQMLENLSKRQFLDYGDISGLFDVNGTTNIFPNPANNVINVLVKNEVKSTYEIFDVTGKIMLIGSLNSDANQINVSDLPAGFYLIKLISDQKQSVNPFVKN